MALPVPSPDAAPPLSLNQFAALWPQLEDLRPAAGNIKRFRQHASKLTAGARTEMLAGLLAATQLRRAPASPRAPDLVASVLRGRIRHAALLALQDRLIPAMQLEWRLGDDQAAVLRLAVAGVVGPPVEPTEGCLALPSGPEARGAGEPAGFPHSHSVFAAAIKSVRRHLAPAGGTAPSCQ